MGLAVLPKVSCLRRESLSGIWGVGFSVPSFSHDPLCQVDAARVQTLNLNKLEAYSGAPQHSYLNLELS